MPHDAERPRRRIARWKRISECLINSAFARGYSPVLELAGAQFRVSGDDRDRIWLLEHRT
jgi:hypothetical protein